ncbi:sigma-E factor regulatory protein RseB domain-containing protein [Streptomyces sp. MP131-18]|uniref:LolA family protein n=1 Tax=Streptomyces sp. MP131-18 TaxID=1857892 RepID=UPI00097BD410|nr:sigma-E factor regulatory protein RseB domain-containing protein [Streptomyces sp. MP131-18]ONK12203.1 Outer membrane lipoprotein-sorting protein [Streptomyces sp. MP131-18]
MAKNSTIRRAAVPAAVVAGVAAVGAGLWPALASDGSPDLPDITAEELLVRMAEADTAQLSGTVRVDADLGIPDFGGMLDGVLSGIEGPAGRLAGLATGDSTLRVAMDGPERQRLAVVNGSDEFAVIHNGDRLWAYDSADNTVYEAEVPAEAAEELPDGPAGEWSGGLTPQDAAARLLDAAGEHADISVDGTARVAGRDAYQLVVEPKDTESGLTSVRISVDGETGVPLAVTADRGDGQALDVSFSQIDYTQPAGGVFDFTPPSDAEIVEVNPEDPFAALGGLEGLEGLLPDAAR